MKLVVNNGSLIGNTWENYDSPVNLGVPPVQTYS